MMTTIHPFEERGLGLAPFSFAGLSEKVYVACQGAPEQPAGICDYCGTGIRYCCHIVSNDGKEFIVGCDCVRKLDRDDNRLVSDMDRQVAKLEKSKRNAKRQAKWAAQCQARDAELQAQRDRNGGRTDAEIEADKRRQEEEAKAVEMRAKNGWLIDVLEQVPYTSNFVSDVLRDLDRRDPSGFSDRCLDILADIYGKTVSKRSRASKEYKQAVETFREKCGADQR